MPEPVLSSRIFSLFIRSKMACVGLQPRLTGRLATAAMHMQQKLEKTSSPNRFIQDIDVIASFQFMLSSHAYAYERIVFCIPT